MTMPKKAISQDRKQSNREHHLTFWDETYKEYPQKIAEDLFTLANLNKRFKEYEHRMKVIDQNRRENAFHMGVPLKESDERYSFDALIKGVPEIVKKMLEYEKKYNVKFGEIRP